ncbi:hypothetical protein, partial [Klebsiella pneumoniae]|uniref:hypothetical protein n=1 Tax=Klebsiella pneumoniae TaxID=573 RepID=UPI001A9399D8
AKILNAYVADNSHVSFLIHECCICAVMAGIMTHPFLFNCDIAGIHVDSAERKHFNQTKVRCSLIAACQPALKPF